MQEPTTRNCHEHLSERAKQSPALPLKRAALASVVSSGKGLSVMPGVRSNRATRFGSAERHPIGRSESPSRPLCRHRDFGSSDDNAYKTGRNAMNRRNAALSALLISTVLFLAESTIAAEVTADRLINADKEPHNWLMNHRSYDAQRYSPLDKINKGNVKSLKLAYAVALGGTSVNENLQATPLVEDGYLYVVDQWGAVYKIDGRSGSMGRIVWRMDPKQEKTPLANRGVALWGNFVISNASYPPRVIATDKDTGKIVWDTNLSEGQVDVQLSAAPLAVKDKIIVGAAGGDRGVRDYIAALDAATGKLLWRKYTVPAPGEPGSET